MGAFVCSICDEALPDSEEWSKKKALIHFFEMHTDVITQFIYGFFDREEAV